MSPSVNQDYTVVSGDIPILKILLRNHYFILIALQTFCSHMVTVQSLLTVGAKVGFLKSLERSYSDKRLIHALIYKHQSCCWQ